MTISEQLTHLVKILDQHDELAIAVSGGLDSMVLAHVAHTHAQTAMTAVHALSPAVPRLATVRVQDHAMRFGWTLQLIDAGELADPAYRNNPVNRCFYCKSNLYERIAAVTGLQIASGTNVDDLGDYRPGLEAARRHDVVHPYVQAGLHKADIYAMAKILGLDDLAVLPAQPCLASRIETGICVEATALGFIENAEAVLLDLLPEAGAIRCRITAEGVYVECETLPLGAEREHVERRIGALCRDEGRRFAGVRSYRRGAAFLRASE
jgi:pyridinium-3,5-biscarboxylic acid mononucleotide sulfurtransferase